MKNWLAVGLFGFSLAAAACPPGQYWEACDGPQFGGGGCIPGCTDVFPPIESLPPLPGFPVGPPELCLGDAGCARVTYRVDGQFMIAESELPQNGYGVMGWAGPCHDVVGSCRDIGNQAHADLRLNALRLTRALRYDRAR